MSRRVVVEFVNKDKAVVYVKGLEPYDTVRLLVSTALAMLEGRAEVIFNEGAPLTPEQQEEIISSLAEKDEPPKKEKGH